MVVEIVLKIKVGILILCGRLLVGLPVWVVMRVRYLSINNICPNKAIRPESI